MNTYLREEYILVEISFLEKEQLISGEEIKIAEIYCLDKNSV